MNAPFSIFFYTFICFSIIYLIHYIFNYLKLNFTKPIIKDFVHAPKVEYDKIASIINSNMIEKSNDENKDENKEENKDENNMQNELKQFMQDELNT